MVQDVNAIASQTSAVPYPTLEKAKVIAQALQANGIVPHFFANNAQGQLNAIQSIVYAAADQFEQVAEHAKNNVVRISNVVHAAMTKATNHFYPHIEQDNLRMTTR